MGLLLHTCVLTRRPTAGDSEGAYHAVDAGIRRPPSTVLYESSFAQTRTELPKHVEKNHSGSNHQEQPKPIVRPCWLFLVVSPDYWFADTLKQSLCSDHKRRFLRECNWFDIAASLVILILLDVLESLALLGGAVLVAAKSFLGAHADVRQPKPGCPLGSVIHHNEGEGAPTWRRPRAVGWARHIESHYETRVRGRLGGHCKCCRLLSAVAWATSIGATPECN